MQFGRILKHLEVKMSISWGLWFPLRGQVQHNTKLQALIAKIKKTKYSLLSGF
jgi:hypothetical protein